MQDFKCEIFWNRVDCSWKFNGLQKSRSFTLDEVADLPDITDNCYFVFTQDENGDLIDPVNLVMQAYNNPEVPLSQLINQYGQIGLTLVAPFRDMTTFNHVALFPVGMGRPLTYYKHWYQPLLLTDCFVQLGSKSKTVFIKAMIEDNFTDKRCHLNSALVRVRDSKDVSNLLSRTVYDLEGETSIDIDTSQMKKGEIYVLRVRSEYMNVYSSPVCNNVILRVKE